MKSVLYILLLLAALSLALYGVYFFTQDLPVYDRFYSVQERNERDVNRIRLSLPLEIDGYTLQIFKKSGNLIQAYDGCSDGNGQGTTDEEIATLCVREIIARYLNATGTQVMIVDFLSITKGFEENTSRTRDSYKESKVHGHKTFRFKNDTDNQVLWYPADTRNSFLKSIGWYPERVFTSISVQQSSSLPDGGESYERTIDTSSPVLVYFLDNYPPE